MHNPLLTSYVLPPFQKIQPKHMVPAIQYSIKNLQKFIKKITSQTHPYTWENLCQPIAEAKNSLMKIWSPIKHLNAVNNTKEIRKSYEQSLHLISQYNNWITHHKKLYQSYKTLKNSTNYLQLTPNQKKSLKNILRDFKLSGIHLSKNKKKKYQQITSELSTLSTKYENNILDATMGWEKTITKKNMLNGVPKNILKNIQSKHKKTNQKQWTITLNLPIYLAILTYCENEKIRKECYYAYNTRASNQGPNANKWDNEPIMKKILKLRIQLANLLGFPTYAHQSLTTKTEKNPQKILSFLNKLLKYAKHKGKKELKQLKLFVKKKYQKNTMYPWDITFYSEKQKQHLFAIDNEKIKSYFPVNQVLQGLFEITKRIYQITFIQKTHIQTWHPHVQFYNIYNSKNQLQGSIYLDIYTRQNKRSGAWMEEYVEYMHLSNKKIQKPVAYIICNFHPPNNNKPTLLTHQEIITLFHEFGHGLHHILAQKNTPGISGINGIPWDIIEFPSQFMENYCWQKTSLKIISKNHITQKSIPQKHLIKILKTKNHHSGLFILYQLQLSLFDFILHYQKKSQKIQKIYEKVRKKISIFPYIPWKRSQNTFSHIFSGEYAAGYYSYLWANKLAINAWYKFQKEGILNQNTGKSFLKNILSMGGSQNPIKLFKKFLGKKPTLYKMLKYYNLIQKKNNTIHNKNHK
ncbi:MAG: oligopeptidase A [Candidatus Westeberhardia cardiocondylae]|nr:oligopeptidase A [Candidatus Westeberhardia cardiocondylae]